MKSAGDSPIGPSTARTEALMLATRPNARPAAMKPAISRSAGVRYTRTRSMGSSGGVDAAHS